MENYIKKLEDFALKHKVVFQDKGEVGFGRPCVGFLHGDNYIDYNPHTYPNFEKAFPDDNDYWPPSEVGDAYHKHQCIAVLVNGDNYEEALRQLVIWVDDMEEKEVYLTQYETGATGIQAMLTGVFGYAFRFKK